LLLRDGAVLWIEGIDSAQIARTHPQYLVRPSQANACGVVAGEAMRRFSKLALESSFEFFFGEDAFDFQIAQQIGEQSKFGSHSVAASCCCLLL
jgi:hypothetical protein